MKTLSTILSLILLSLFASTTQCAVINVTSESLYMNSEVTLEYLSGRVQTYRSSYLGSVFAGDRSVDAYHDDHYIEESDWPGSYDHVAIDMDAQFESGVGLDGTYYWLDVETDVYSMGDFTDPDPLKLLASAFDYESLIEICMEFYVEGDDAMVDFSIYNEGAYAPVAFTLDDLTSATQVASLYSESPLDPGSASAALLDGHYYSLHLMFSEQCADDDDLSGALDFYNAELVKVDVPEPALSILLFTGLGGLGIGRRFCRS